MDCKLLRFKSHVIEISKNPQFIHHKWFIEYHLSIVEKMAFELCEFYPEADKDIIFMLVWMHDYGKIIDFDNQYEMTLNKGKEKMGEIGFDDAFIATVMEYVGIIDKKNKVNIADQPIEIQIVSSADGCSHFSGPFFFMWWHENPQNTYQENMISNQKKAIKDWDKKIVLPEARTAFQSRYDQLLEMSGILPDAYFR